MNVIIFIKIVLTFVHSIEMVLLWSSENNILKRAGNNSIYIVLKFVNSIENYYFENLKIIYLKRADNNKIDSRKSY